MDAVFTLTFPEYEVAQELAKALPKKTGCGISVPLSRQQKGWDLLAYSQLSRKAVSIQIKGSRSYPGKEPKYGGRQPVFNYYLWFRKFTYSPRAADFYCLFGLSAKKNLPKETVKRPRVPREWWESRILLFTDKEMGVFLAALQDNFFAFGYDSGSRSITLVRGRPEFEDYSNHIIGRRHEMLQAAIT